MADLEFEAPKAASLKKADFINREIEYSNFRYMFGGLDLSGARSSFVKGSSFIDPKASAKYSTVKIRWFMLFQFAMSLASTTFQMMSFASISSVIASIFEVDSVVVNFNVMVYLFAFVLFNFASISAIEFSTKWTFKICAIANIVGSWGKWFALYATSNFYYLVVVQTFLACFQPFLGNGASKVATVWFGDDERAMATAVGSLSNPLGCIIGLVLGPYFVPESDKFHENEEAGKKAVIYYMFASAWITTAMNICTVIFFEEKPASFPSESAENSTKIKFSMKQDAKDLCKNKNYLLLLMSFSLMYGVYACLGAVINNLVEPYDFDSTDAGRFGAIFILSGLVGSFSFSANLDKHGNFIKCLRVATFGTLVLACLLIGALQTKNVYLVSLNIGFLGAFVLPIIPVGYSFAVKVSYPVSEVMSTGSMMLVGQLTGVLSTIVASNMSQTHGKHVPILLSGIIGASALISLLVRDENNGYNSLQEDLNTGAGTSINEDSTSASSKEKALDKKKMEE